MIAYTITAPLAAGLTYKRTESFSSSASLVYTRGEGTDTHLDMRSWKGKREEGYIIDENGGETHTGNSSGEGVATYPKGYPSEVNNYVSFSYNRVYQPDGNYQVNGDGIYKSTFLYPSPDESENTTFTNGGPSTDKGHVMASPNAPKDSNGNIIQAALYDAEKNLYFGTFALQTTTKTQVVSTIRKPETTTRQKLAKVGTTTTQSIGTDVVTLPTTTNAKSWTENAVGNYTSSTENKQITTVTTSMGINSIWKKTTHTVYILEKGETAAFLKENVALNATNGGETDTGFYDTYSGPKTFTITRNEGITSQLQVIDATENIGYDRGDYVETTRTWVSPATSAATYYYPRFPAHFPLSSASFPLYTNISISSRKESGYLDDGSWLPNSPTATRSVVRKTTSAYEVNGVTWDQYIDTFSTESYSQNYLRSKNETFSGLDSSEGRKYEMGGASGEGQSGNRFVSIQNYAFRVVSNAALNAYYHFFFAWGTLGGTTAEPRQSISVNGIASSESVTWPFVSISAGVQTPKPFVTVSQKPETSKTSSTAANKTEITKRRIWGDEFFKLTSSKNSSTGTSGSTTTPIEAGGAALTYFRYENGMGLPVYELAGGWIPLPDIFVVGGIAQTENSTAIIPPGEYFNTTLANPTTFSGSSIANTYFMIKKEGKYVCSPL